MAFWKKKTSMGDDTGMPSIPDEELPPLPPLPGEEEAPEAMPRAMRPAGAIPEVSMSSAPSWKPPSVMAPMAPAADKATVFVRLDKYREIMKTIDMMQAKIEELTGTLERISAVKQREGEIIDGWHAMLSDAKAKMEDLSGKLTKPEA
jgi:hypothetical protein